MGEFKRRAGQPLRLKFMTFPADNSLFVRAFLFDENMASIGSPINLTSVGNGCYTENSFAMTSNPEIVAKYKAYEDAAFTIDACEYPGASDIFELDDLLPTQLPDSVDISAQMEVASEFQVDISPSEIKVDLEITNINVKIESEDEIVAKEENVEMATDFDSDEFSANLNCH